MTCQLHTLCMWGVHERGGLGRCIGIGDSPQPCLTHFQSVPEGAPVIISAAANAAEDSATAQRRCIPAVIKEASETSTSSPHDAADEAPRPPLLHRTPDVLLTEDLSDRLWQARMERWSIISTNACVVVMRNVTATHVVVPEFLINGRNLDVRNHPHGHYLFQHRSCAEPESLPGPRPKLLISKHL